MKATTRHSAAGILVVVAAGLRICQVPAADPVQAAATSAEPFPGFDEDSPEARFEAICEAWRFPKSDGNLGGGGAMAYADEEGLVPAIWKFTWRSTEPYADIWNFYAEECGHDGEYDENSFGIRTGRNGGAFYLVDDRLWLPNAELLASTFVYNGPDYVATVVLRPPTDERGTYIILTIANCNYD